MFKNNLVRIVLILVVSITSLALLNGQYSFANSDESKIKSLIANSRQITFEGSKSG